MNDAEAAWKALVEDDPFHPVDPKFATAATRDLLELYAVEGRWDDATQLIWKSYSRANDTADRQKLLNMRLRTELDRIAPVVAAEKMESYLARRSRGLGGPLRAGQGSGGPEPPRGGPAQPRDLPPTATGGRRAAGPSTSTC